METEDCSFCGKNFPKQKFEKHVIACLRKSEKKIWDILKEPSQYCKIKNKINITVLKHKKEVWFWFPEGVKKDLAQKIFEEYQNQKLQVRWALPKEESK